MLFEIWKAIWKECTLFIRFIPYCTNFTGPVNYKSKTSLSLFVRFTKTDKQGQRRFRIRLIVLQKNPLILNVLSAIFIDRRHGTKTKWAFQITPNLAVDFQVKLNLLLTKILWIKLACFGATDILLQRRHT